MHDIPTIGHEDAGRAIAAIRDAAAARGKQVVVAVADSHGELVALLRMDGAAYPSGQVAANKAFTAARLRRPPSVVGANVRDPETGFDIGFYGDPRFVGFGGGLPVMVDGRTLGAVAVSGLSQAEDEELAAIGVDAILR
ncbi:MAG: GlcG/HbpS family heme-binding protein [Alphaproteobacteria bacterium]